MAQGARLTLWERWDRTGLDNFFFAKTHLLIKVTFINCWLRRIFPRGFDRFHYYTKYTNSFDKVGYLCH